MSPIFHLLALAFMSPAFLDAHLIENLTLLELTRSPIQSAVNSFTVDFLKNQVKSEPKANIIFSPLSIQIIYSLLMNGAHGETKDDIYRTLHLDHLGPPNAVFQEFGQVTMLMLSANELINSHFFG